MSRGDGSLERLQERQTHSPSDVTDQCQVYLRGVGGYLQKVIGRVPGRDQTYRTAAYGFTLEFCEAAHV